jgi:hypothetical protein
MPSLKKNALGSKNFKNKSYGITHTSQNFEKIRIAYKIYKSKKKCGIPCWQNHVNIFVNVGWVSKAFKKFKNICLFDFHAHFSVFFYQCTHCIVFSSKKKMFTYFLLVLSSSYCCLPSRKIEEERLGILKVWK